MKLVDIYVQLKGDVESIERTLEQSMDTRTRELYQSSTHLLKAGGKRIRPVFVLLGGKWGEYDIERLKHVAVPLELIHMATLVHDDVIDDADKRRGRETVKAKWDNRIAMYTGDYIFARALTIATKLSNPRIHQILSKAIVEMCKGEIEQVRDLNNWDQGLKHYLRRIKRKTALLIAISCQLGAIASNAPEDRIRSMYRYGYNVGMAFQIADDLLDFTASEKQLGKPVGSDLRQGNITLPALYSLWFGQERRRLRDWLEQDAIHEHIEEAIALIREGEGIAYARSLAQRYLNRARTALSDLPDNKTKRSLLEIADFIIERNF
ncbi:heptaprenyl diphosphate synthase component II [Brevibacillus humidisoli]|uniref:heptaprenyl diphosphate synthase component II n=1 Tax=Brevibacillus humidisoli TaxID=2895522 RepID=UPI001E47D58A|nr:heptaprenyl diphosphate synthase component II [Brevibacillus humidisoli]UFJ42782.1 heptaprenyl diphosphate synthase component II [Brevibacillus humidisoli]